MKVVRLIPPILALACVVSWNLHQRRSARALEDRIRELGGRIAETGAERPVPEATAKPATRRTLLDDPSKKNLPLDWRYLSTQILLAEKGRTDEEFDPAVTNDFAERLGGMTREELLMALDEIAALGLEPAARKALEDSFIEPLIDQDPALALERFSDRIKNDPDGEGARLSPALEAWANKDLAAASAWFDRGIGAGLFESKSLDGRNPLRQEFEAGLLGVMLNTDSTAAAKRIESLPTDERAETMQQIAFSRLDPEAQRKYIELTRTLLPDDERGGPFGSAFCELIPDGDYAKATTFLDGIQATPEERGNAAGWAVNNQLDSISEKHDLAREDIEAAREWLNRQAPEKADRLLGEALGQASQADGDQGFVALAKLVLDMPRGSGSDEVLAAFLESSSPSVTPELVRRFAEKISNPARREEILESLK